MDQGNSFESERIMRKVVCPEDLEDPDKAGILYFKAATIRECGLHALPQAIDTIRKAVLMNPDEIKWTLKLMQYEGYKRRMNRTTDEADLSSLETIVATADSILQTNPDQKMAVKFKYEQFQAINDFIKSYRAANYSQWDEKRHVRDKCTELAEEIVRTTDCHRQLSNCAQYLANDKRNIDRAVEIIEKALEQRPLDTYINGKASNIYRKANKLDEALKCAEVAAGVSVGSYLQVLHLKTDLGQPFDLREFFTRGLDKYYQLTDRRLLYVNAFIHLTCFTLHFKQAVEYFKLFLDTEPPEYNMYEWSKNKRINVGEAAYNLVLYVLSGDDTFKDDEFNMEEDKYMFEEVEKRIKEKCDVREFGNTTPKKYMEWIREENVVNLPNRPFFKQYNLRQEMNNERSSSSSCREKSQDGRQRQYQPTNWRQERRNEPPTAETHDDRQSTKSFNWRQEQRTEPPSCTDWRKERNEERSLRMQPAQQRLANFRLSARPAAPVSSWTRKSEENDRL